RIAANGPAGFFYGVQTFLQLLPPEVYARETVDGIDWSAPAVAIRDFPRFGWRGLMLDFSRHMFGKQDVLRFLDAMSMHKLSVFHMHLTDDQGWRIEIKRHPRL